MASKIYLHFLRPLSLPRCPFLLNDFRQLSTFPYSPREGNVDIESCALEKTAEWYKATTKFPPPAEEPKQTLQYHIHRTPSQQLPVYQLSKRGGNLHQTKIRKISGNLEQLRHDIQQALGLTDERIMINQLTRHIIIKVFHGGNRNRNST